MKLRICTFLIGFLAAIAASPAGARVLASSDIQDRVEGTDENPVFLQDMVAADFNDDGAMDLAISSWGPDGSTAVVVVSGAHLPWKIMEATEEMAFVAMGQPEPDDEFGASLAAGDVTGDGIPDLVVGAPGSTNPGYGGADLYNAGRIYIFAGGDISDWKGSPFSIIMGDQAEARLGEKVAVGPLLGIPNKHEVVGCAPGFESIAHIGEVGGLLVWSDLPGNAGMDGAAIKLVQDGLVCSDLAVGPHLVGDGAADIFVGDATAEMGAGVLYVVDAVETAVDGLLLSDNLALTVRPSDDVAGLGAAVVIASDLGLGGSGPEVAVGAPDSRDGSGGVVLLDLEGLSPDINQLDTSAAIGRIVSDTPYHQVGGSLAVTDGFGGLPNSQLWIGAWDSNAQVDGGGGMGLFDQNIALAGGSEFKYTDLPGRVDGTVDGGHFGKLIVSGDLDGDGHPDVIVVEPDSHNGALYILRSMRFHNADADGFLDMLGDCDDGNDQIQPYAEELCDGLDNDCDEELMDEEMDQDGDGWFPCDGDCDDDNGDVHPDRHEDCEDGVDNDCDGAVDGDDEECGGTPGDDDDFIPGDDDDAVGADADVAGDDDVAPAGFHCMCETAASGAPAGTWLLLSLLALLIRRR